MSSANRSDAAFLADQSAQQWATVMTRIASAEPENIDDFLAPANGLAVHERGKSIFAHADGCLIPVRHDGRRPVIAVVLPDQEAALAPDETQLLAMRYAALAIEKECDIVVITHRDRSGFERFGFRVERIAGETEEMRSACLDSLRQFWGFDIQI